MYRVRSEQRKDGPVYYVANDASNAMPGEFDSPVNAQNLADYLNGRKKNCHTEKQTKQPKRTKGKSS